jgi:hypothetical protein
MKVPTGSTWKLVDGQWYWYVDQDALRQSPFGKMTPGPYPKGPASAPGLPPSLPNLEQMEKLFSQQVKVDKSSVTLKPGESGQVTVTNGSQGTITVELTGEIPGVDIKLDKMDIPAGQKAVVTLRAGAGAKPGVLSLRVEQTNQVFSIQVNVP